MGGRSDGRVYDELTSQVARMGDDLKIRPLKDVITQMGRLYVAFEAIAEPTRESILPKWVEAALKELLHLPLQEMSELTEQQAQQKLKEHWSKTQGS